MAQVTVQQAVEIALEHQKSGRTGQAEDIFRQLENVIGNNPSACHSLGQSAERAGLGETALRFFRKAAALQPNLPNTWHLLGVALAKQRKFPEAIDAISRAATLDPRDFTIVMNLGMTLQDAGQHQAALEAYSRASTLNPAIADPHWRIGKILLSAWRPEEAAICFQKAIELQPGFVSAHSNLALAMQDLGLADDAISIHKKAAELATNEPVSDAYLFALHLSDTITPETILQEHRNWATRATGSVGNRTAFHFNDRTPDRILRIGYVSPDLRDHPVGNFLLQSLKQHDRRLFNITCYSNSWMEDQVTTQMRALAHAWRNTAGWSDQRFAAQIIEDRIDILVDLAQHTAGNRIQVLAARPAPVQIAYLGHLGTTGLETFDARLSDPFLDPPGETESLYSEPIVRLPETYWCFSPISSAPPVKPTPALESGFVTFGCLNKLAKSSPSALRTWAAILKRVPNSRLILSAPPGNHRKRILDIFASDGVESSRIEMVSKLSFDEYLELYQRVDIALDPFPYNGGTTTCHALWMGVPVITLTGKAGVQRGGVSLLNSTGFAELVADNTEQYIQLAANLAGDIPRLASMRQGMRDRVSGSPLMNVPRFVDNLEAIYRNLWQQWCARDVSLPAKIEALQHALLANPGNGNLRFSLGQALHENGQFEAAVEAFGRALDSQFKSPSKDGGVDHPLLESESRDQIAQCCRETLAHNPDHVLSHCLLGLILLHTGMATEAIAHQRKLTELAPHEPIHYDNLLNTMRLSDSVSAGELFQEHLRWAERFAEPLCGKISTHANDRSPQRILRVGYVSPDFRSHSVGIFLRQILPAHDRSQFHITCYSNSKIDDEVTATLRSTVQDWRLTADWNDERLAKQIADDKIDILIDLAQHSAGNRLLVFARKPAPVQITYLGYPGTTGLKTFDAQISDPYIDLPGETEQFSTEPIVRLPESYWCYRSVLDVPAQSAPPSIAAGHVTFGCLNKFEKSSPSAMAAWAMILSRVANSRLILTAPPGEHRQRIFDLFKSNGIDADRIKLVPRQSMEKYFETFNRIDIAIDPFPYNGGTTTCDALWMGVPVITLAGQAGVQRSGVSLLSNIGLTELIATSPQQYVNIAAELAADLPRLSSLRQSIREKMLASPLMDVPRFVKNLEAIYRRLWIQWCV